MSPSDANEPAYLDTKAKEGDNVIDYESGKAAFRIAKVDRWEDEGMYLKIVFEPLPLLDEATSQEILNGWARENVSVSPDYKIYNHSYGKFVEGKLEYETDLRKEGNNYVLDISLT